MTRYQLGLFSKLLDVNFELQTEKYNKTVTEALQARYAYLENEIEEDMGRDEWRTFITNGRKMFS